MPIDMDMGPSKWVYNPVTIDLWMTNISRPLQVERENFLWNNIEQHFTIQVVKVALVPITGSAMFLSRHVGKGP